MASKENYIMTTIRFEDTTLMNTVIYPVVMAFDGESVQLVRMSDVVNVCKERAVELFGSDKDYPQILAAFIAYVGSL